MTPPNGGTVLEGWRKFGVAVVCAIGIVAISLFASDNDLAQYGILGLLGIAGVQNTVQGILDSKKATRDHYNNGNGRSPM